MLINNHLRLMIMKKSFRFIGYGILTMVLLFGMQHLLYGQQSQEDVYPLWSGGPIPTREEMPVLKGVKFHMVKRHQPEVDQFHWAHGAAIVRYNKHWVATFGLNRGGENSAGEEADAVTSKNGKRWSGLIPIGIPEKPQAISHGILFNHNGDMWAFQGAFTGSRKGVHMQAYQWNEKKRQWEAKGTVAEDGFWPLQEPQQMANGEWIIGGASIGKTNPPAVAICKDGNFTHWEVVKIPSKARVWGESGVIIDGANLLLVSRSDGKAHDLGAYTQPPAWVSVSKDYGRSWSELKPSNLPMASSKPYVGILSNGQRYLIGSISSNSGNQRHPLSIAVSKPGENTFSKVFAIRKSLQKGDVESVPNAGLSYPYAVEYKKKLWVVYSNNGGRGGNRNSIELAIIPIKELKAE